VQGFLQRLKSSDEIWRGRLIKLDGTVVFSTDTQEVQRAVMAVPPELFAENQILQGTRVEGGQRLSVVMRPVLNSESCQRCHDAKGAAIGAIIVEKSFTPAEASVASNRNLLIVYGVVIFVLVGIVLWLLIVRLVTQPVRHVLDQMRKVQTGDLDARAVTETADEVGELASEFNAMVQSLDNATRELEESHEKQIQQAGKLASIGELASGIAHEIRNPLAGIGAAVEVLSEENDLNGQRVEIVGEIRRQITRLNRTLHDLLEFARLRDPEIAPCDVNEFIRPMLALVRPDAQKCHITIEEHYGTDLPGTSADVGQMQQALLNILLNGVQAMPNGGTLTISTESAERGGSDAVRIQVRDTGVGIAREHLAKIFSPFFTTKHRGTGLGLSITRTIVEKHHGIITVESEPGKGTTFTLVLAACTCEMVALPSEREARKELAHAAN
jgi:signal transduction histidine kinase